MANKTVAIGAIVVVIIVVAGVLIFTSYPGTSYKMQSGGIAAPILLTDPAQVPANTSALVITYTSLMVHSSGGQGSGWVNATGSGTVNLLAVVNSSKVIGYANVSANSTINLVRFEISSAQITINGTVYNVTVPNSQLTVAVTGKNKIAPNAAVMIDVSPVVAAIYANNSTKFVMAPAARAVVVSNVSLSGGNSEASVRASIGTDIEVNDNAEEFQSTRANISITNASLVVSGNATTLMVSVKDNSNMSVALDHVILFGVPMARPTVSASANTSVRGEVEDILAGRNEGNASLSANSVARVGLNIVALRVINFLVNANGSLSLPTSEESFQGDSFNLSSGGTTTLRFNGTVSYNDNAFVVTPTVGQNYRLTVIGNEDAFATANVTAT